MIRLFADDTSLYLIVDTPLQTAHVLNQDLLKITDWADKWLVTFNPQNTEALLLSRKINEILHPPLLMNNHAIVEVETRKHLGVMLENNCNWLSHINMISSKAWQRIYI